MCLAILSSRIPRATRHLIETLQDPEQFKDDSVLLLCLVSDGCDYGRQPLLQDTLEQTKGKLIRYARLSTRSQDADRQITDLLGAGVRRDDLYTDHGVSGASADRPRFDKALKALHKGDTLVITTLDRVGRYTANTLDLSPRLRERGIGLRVLNLGGGAGEASTPLDSMVFPVMGGAGAERD